MGLKHRCPECGGKGRLDQTRGRSITCGSCMGMGDDKKADRWALKHSIWNEQFRTLAAVPWSTTGL